MKFKHLTLNALVASDLNVRKSQDNAQRFNELRASIAHYGVQTPLHIIAGENGIYEVVAGGRRLRALQALAEDGVIDSATNTKNTPFQAYFSKYSPKYINITKN